MSIYSQLPIYNDTFFLLKDLYERVPKFGKQYKYMLGEKMLGCCINILVLITKNCWKIFNKSLSKKLN